MKTIKDFTDTELKAMAFEQLQQIEMCQNNLKAINQELASRAQNAPVAPSEPQGEDLKEELKEVTA